VLSVHQGDGSPASFEVVGVAPDINYLSVDGRSSCMVYLPLWAMPVEARGLSILLRAQGDLRATMERLRGTLVPERPGSPLGLPQTYDTALAAESSPDIKNLPFMLGILAIPAILALIVAVVGIASVTAETVAASRRGLAIRAAVGAPPAALVRQVLGHAFVKVGLGLLIPLGMASVLFSSGGPGGPPLGPILISTIFLSIVGGGLAIVITACYLPARVAARVDVAQLARDE
jgi:putative ABC transport system permease protein